MRLLNVKEVTKLKLMRMWNMPVPKRWDDNLYIRCNGKGEVNWEKAPVYHLKELKERGNYLIWR